MISITRSRTRPRLLAGSSMVAAAALVTSLAAPAGAVTAPARSSSDWLVTQLDDGLVNSEYQDPGGTWQSYVDYGLALDFYFSLTRLRVRPIPRAGIVDAIEPEADNYTGRGTTEYAGALGKLLAAVQARGLDPSEYAAGDLLPRLEELVQDSGAEQGRAKDRFDPTQSWAGDNSNAFGQSYVVTALTNADSAEADDALRFLLKQQCSAGFFRESMESSDFTCDSGTTLQSRPDVDATATVAIALRDIQADLPAPLRDQARAAAGRATRWLASRQVDTGTFVGGRNANSTGLAATALAASGRDRLAAKAARWVNRLRVTARIARTTALRPRDIGAVAYNPAALTDAKREGLTRGARYEWRRATAQAVPALDEL